MDEPKPMRELTRIREERGLSQQGLADASGVNKATINQIERGRRSPNLETLEKLAGALAVEMGDLFPKAQAPLPLEESERGGAPGIPFSAERALTLADSDSVRRGAKGASVEELQQTALELAAFMKPQTLEDPSSREETYRRVIARERLGIIEGELYLRKAPSPVKLVIKRDNDAMTPTEETLQRSHEEQKGKETA
jgi:transcriptional regulator with XRE-family HTH domain